MSRIDFSHDMTRLFNHTRHDLDGNHLDFMLGTCHFNILYIFGSHDGPCDED